MKKILALVLVAVMALCAVSALAAGSKDNTNIAQATTDSSVVDLEKAEDTEATSAIKQAVTDAQEAGNAVDGLPDAVKEQLGEGFTVINEMDTYKLSGDYENAEDPIILTFKFETPYEEGEKVILAIGICPPDAEEAEWLVKEGAGNADGDVEVTVTKAELQKISDNPFVVIPVRASK